MSEKTSTGPEDGEEATEVAEIKVGIIGVGSFGVLHVDAFRVVPGVVVEAVCDVDEERLTQISTRYGIPGIYTDYRELCAREDIDVVSVVTPETDHVDPVVAAAQAGKHIFLEKPLATSLEDGQRIIQAADQAGVFLMVGHILRFENRYATVKRLIEEGEFGRIVSIHARRNRARGLYTVYGNRIHGLLVNAIHDIDLCLWYTQDKVKRVRGMTRNIQGGTYPDINWGLLEFEKGGVACLETHWMIPDRAGVTTDDSMQVIGTEGIANLALVPSGLTLWQEQGAVTSNVFYDAWFHGEIRGPIKEEIGYFVDCVRKNESPQVITPQEAYEALKVALALVRSAAEDKEIDVS